MNIASPISAYTSSAGLCPSHWMPGALAAASFTIAARGPSPTILRCTLPPSCAQAFRSASTPLSRPSARTHPAGSEERGVGTEEAEVMQRLDHGDGLCPGGVVGGRGNQRKRIVEMGDLRPMFADQRADLVMGRPAPDRARHRLEATQGVEG